MFVIGTLFRKGRKILYGDIRMKNIVNSAIELVGNTPLMKVDRYGAAAGVKDVTLLAKLEYFNPAGSTKDRAALSMIEDAEEKGILKPGATIIEPTSGNTGIGLASMAAIKGYKTILTLPDTMSVERRNLPGAVILGQFENHANAAAHRKTTGPEIWEQTEGKVDIFVAGVGTGGTITGVGEYLKSKNPSIKIVAVEPAGSPLLSGGQAGAHQLQGIGANFVPELLNTEIYDEVISAST